MDEDRYLTFLATSSNLAPFFGLLGTVWGIMIAFFQIGHHGSFTSKNGSNETSYYNFGSQVLSLFKRGDMLAVEGVAEEEA